jgi:hypothetical protein
MGLLVLHGRDHAKGRVESAVVVPVDPAGGGVLDVGEGLVRPVVEDGGTNAFGLEQADDRQMAHAAVVVGARSGTTTCGAPALAAVVVVPAPWCTTAARDHRRSGQRNHRHRRSRPGHASGTPLKIKSCNAKMESVDDFGSAAEERTQAVAGTIRTDGDGCRQAAT